VRDVLAEHVVRTKRQGKYLAVEVSGVWAAAPSHLLHTCPFNPMHGSSRSPSPERSSEPNDAHSPDIHFPLR
jgi:hypothetical protein